MVRKSSFNMQSIEQWHKASMLPLVKVLSQRHGSLHGARPLVFLAHWRLWRRLPEYLRQPASNTTSLIGIRDDAGTLYIHPYLRHH